MLGAFYSHFINMPILEKQNKTKHWWKMWLLNEKKGEKPHSSQMAVRIKWSMSLLQESNMSVKSEQKGTEQKATFQKAFGTKWHCEG